MEVAVVRKKGRGHQTAAAKLRGWGRKVRKM